MTTVFPHRHAWSYAALVVIALGLLWVSLPVPKLPAVPQASSDWTTRMGLRPTAEFDFISRYAGPGATLVRYRLASGDDERAVAVDVITSPNLARLRDYDDAIWYPSPMPLNYKSAYLPGPVTVSARDVHSNPDRAQRQDSADWYALTWLWHTQKGYQRVTVVVNQARPSADPPEPQALTWRNSLLEPLLWVARQQPYSRGVVSPSVLDIADTLSHQILVAGAPK